MRKLRIGIVGAGYIAGLHSAAYLTVPGTYAEAPRLLQLVAVADSDRQRAIAASSQWGWGRAQTEWQAITRAEDIDLVDICVPNALHAEIAVDALAHGKHVICEKPLAHDLASAEAMHAAASTSDRLAQVCFYYRLWPAISWAHQLVTEGHIGAINHFRGWMLQDYAATPGHSLGWRANRGTAGAGALGDLGSHIIDIARYLCGEIAAVNAITRSLLERPSDQAPIDDAAAMLVEFASGATGVIEAGWAMRGHKADLGFDLLGSSGSIRFTWERSNEIDVLVDADAEPGRASQRVLIGPEQADAARFAGVPGQGLGYRDAFTIGIGHLVSAIAQGRPNVSPSFEDGLRAAEVVAAASAAADSRTWKSITEIRADGQ